jgi:hypothetical protein
MVRLKNELEIYESAFGMVHGQPYKGFQKSSIYKF